MQMNRLQTAATGCFVLAVASAQILSEFVNSAVVQSAVIHADDLARNSGVSVRKQVYPLHSYGHQLCLLPTAENAESPTPAGDEIPDASDGIQQTFRPVIPTPADQEPKGKTSSEAGPVRAKVFPQFDRLERGSRCLIAVELTIDEKWHINANPANPDFLVPTEVKIATRQKIKVKRVIYPKHQLLQVQGAEEPYHVYGGRTMIYLQVETDASESAAAAELEVHVKYQACNKDTCVPPDEVVLQGTIPLANPGDAIRRINEGRFPKSVAASKSTDGKQSKP